MVPGGSDGVERGAKMEAEDKEVARPVERPWSPDCKL